MADEKTTRCGSHTLSDITCAACGMRLPARDAGGEAPRAAGADGRAAKGDGDKLPLHLLAPDFLVAVAEVLAYGARKYQAWNWARGKAWSRDYGAALRHLNAWWGGEDRDPETGLSHLAHAATDLMFLLVSQARGLGTDDRWRFPQPPRAAGEVRGERADRDAARGGRATRRPTAKRRRP